MNIECKRFQMLTRNDLKKVMGGRQEPRGDCAYSGQRLADDTMCQMYYVCDEYSFPVRYICPGSACFITDTCVDDPVLCPLLC